MYPYLKPLWNLTFKRLGPRPLPLHLMQAQMMWATLLQNLPLKKTKESKTLKPFLKSLSKDDYQALLSVDQNDLQKNVQQKIMMRMGNFLKGIQLYHHHSFTRKDLERNVLDIGSAKLIFKKQNLKLPPLLLIPSMINSPIIFDMDEENSWLNFFEDAGFCVYLLEWSDTSNHLDFCINDFLEQFLTKAIDHLCKTHKVAKVTTIGYCMGGTLSLIQACVDQRLDPIVTIATPWDFHNVDDNRQKQYQHLRTLLEPAIAFQNVLSSDFLSLLFHMISPQSVVKKFVNFANLDQNSDEAKQFVMIEDWSNGTFHLSKKIAKEAILDWHADNIFMEKKHSYCGQIIDAKKLKSRHLSIAGSFDKIVQASTTHGPKCDEKMILDAGHVGLVFGDFAQKNVMPIILKWLQRQNRKT